MFLKKKYPLDLLYKKDNFFIISHLKCGYSTLENLCKNNIISRCDNSFNCDNTMFLNNEIIFLYRNIYIRNISYFVNCFCYDPCIIKFIDTTNDLYYKILDLVKNNEFIEAYKCFLKLLQNSKVIYQDPHLIHQTKMIQECNIKVSFFINLDNKSDMDLFFKILETDQVKCNEQLKKKHINNLLYNFIINNNEYKCLLADLYKIDIDFFEKNKLL